MNIIGPKSSNIFYIYPETLDFSSSDSLYIIILAEKIYRMSGFKLNPDREELACDINLGKCIVPRSHFKNNGYYYIHHKNNINKYSIDYGIFGVKVSGISNKNGKKNNSKITKYSFVLLLLSCFLL